jgi:hypothetical protein
VDESEENGGGGDKKERGRTRLVDLVMIGNEKKG